MFTKLEQLIESAPKLDFGDIFNASIDLFKKIWLQGLITLLITMALMIPFYLIIYFPLIAMGIINPEALDNGDSASAFLMVPFVVFAILFGAIAATIAFTLKAAFFRICKNKDLGIEEADDYFYYFKKPYFVKAIKLGLATVGISLLATMLCVLPIIYVAVPIAFINVVFAYNPDLSVSEIIKLSFKLGNKKWLLTFGLMIVTGLLAEFVGILLCGIGVLVTASFAYLPVYLIYKKVIGFEDKDDIEEIGSAL
ncbi:hypothetical protein [Mangrovimonas aestuarii]|uniref:hypothetical protein n=1 Tax=Mangrovimonas aestuarii TaxID=3018443 RepID=UPI002379F00A|nr:hypothetical protein [Mangrovimonas aestuarii]